MFEQLRSALGFGAKNVLPHSTPLAVHVLNTSIFRAPGGLERFVLDATQFAHDSLGIRSILISPAPDAGEMFEVFCNSIKLGSFSLPELQAMFRSRKLQIESIHVHHMMNWELSDFFSLCGSLWEHDAFKVLYIHDAFFVSRVESEGEQREALRQALIKFFRSFSQIVCPSESAKNTFCGFYPETISNARIVPHLLYRFIEVEKQELNRKIDIVFSGACGMNKGIDRYEALMKDLNSRFRFTTVGIENRFAGNPLVEHVHYSFHEGGDMTQILRNLRPAVAYLASVVPETFSYTLHEMLAAGIPVICTAESGNIAAKVKELQCGKVFPDFPTLLRELETRGEEELGALLAASKRYEISLNTGGLRALFGREQEKEKRRNQLQRN